MKSISNINQSEKIPVLHLLGNLWIGGAEILLLHIIKALGSKDYRHFAYFFVNDGPIRTRLEYLGVNVKRGRRRSSIYSPIKCFMSTINLVQDLLRFIKQNNIKIIQSHLGEPNQLAVLISKLSGVPVFTTVHTPNAFEYKIDRFFLRGVLNKTVDNLIYRLADRVLVVSKETKEVIQNEFGIPSSKILFLNNGIVFDQDALVPSSGQKIKPASSNNIRIIAVGRLVRLKNFDILLKAVNIFLSKSSVNITVQIVGDGEERKNLESLIYKLRLFNHVKLLGFRDDVLFLMKSADIFVIPSAYEGLSIAMIEAMACGLPIVASNARGLRDNIVHEQNGLLFPVGDYEALAHCIIRLTNDTQLRKKVSFGARNSFNLKYDMRKNIKYLDELFRKYSAGVKHLNN